MHILLIDDSASTRSLLRTLINSQQAVRHLISEAESGEEALRKLDSGEIAVPDIVIVDLNMEGMNGYEVVRQVRQRFGANVKPYIIIITANEGVEVINTALEAGANDYMSKPVHVKTLQVRLRIGERILQQQPGEKKEVEGRAILAAWAIEYVDVPLVLIEVTGAEPSLRIAYANAAMTRLTQLPTDGLIGHSLATLESWTAELSAAAGQHFAALEAWKGVPLASTAADQIALTLDFIPVRQSEEPVVYYLVLHHQPTS